MFRFIIASCESSENQYCVFKLHLGFPMDQNYINEFRTIKIGEVFGSHVTIVQLCLGFLSSVDGVVASPAY